VMEFENIERVCHKTESIDDLITYINTWRNLSNISMMCWLTRGDFNEKKWKYGHRRFIYWILLHTGLKEGNFLHF
jgi:hypothetical protein